MKDLLLYVISFLRSRRKCRHYHALLSGDEGYCPDCGQYLKKYYYVLRCKCCHHKREASRAVFGEYNEVVPVSKFCPQCGGEEFYIEKYEKLNLVDISYAIEVKEVYDPAWTDVSSTKIWVEVPEGNAEEAFEEEFNLPKRLTGGAPLLIQGV